MSEISNNGAGALAHHLDCESNLSAMEYDSRCPRCSKIKAVIALGRKTEAQGCSPQEAATAQALALTLRAKYKLTRGECYDREYSEFIIQAVQYARVYKAERLKPKRFVRKANIDA